jgi:CheY-like chemotaxis protein
MILKRVLIVDDAMELGRLYQESLRTMYPGVPVTFVPSAEEALLEATRFTFDLMIVDIRLPGMSGLELVTKIRIRQPGIKTVVITGLRIDEALQKRVDAVKADKLLHKPLSVSEFLDAIQEVINEGSPVVIEAPKDGQVKTAPTGKPSVNEIPAPPIRIEEKSAPVLPLLGEALANLRGSVGATAVMLLDDTGRTAANAGDWPQPNLAEKLTPALMVALSASEKVNRQLDGNEQASPAVQAAVGRDFSLVYASVGSYTLLIFLKNEPGRVRMALAFDEALAAQKQLADVLTGMGINLHPGSAPKAEPAVAVEQPAAPSLSPIIEAAVAPVETAEDLTNLHTLEAILGKPMELNKSVDADAFWDDLTSSAQNSNDNPDALSYDQARKLGLLPEDENKE